MKKLMLIVGMIATVSSAQADGFKCKAEDHDLNIAVYNHTDPSDGTRNAAIMVLSDPTVQQGNKTIARFTDANSTLSNSAASYVAKVDLRYNDSERGGENVMGTKLRNIDAIKVIVSFSYTQATEKGELHAGKIIVRKRNGEFVRDTLVCKRYLKN